MSQQEEFTIFIVPLPVLMEDDPLHTDEHPFCEDDSCPCKSDGERISKYISEPFNNGLLTNAEVVRMYNNKQIA